MYFHTLFLQTVKAWKECMNVLPFSVPVISEGPGKNVWMCFLPSLFLETVKALTRMYGCPSILCSWKQSWSRKECMDVLPFFVPGNCENPGKNLWMCCHSLFLESVKAWQECMDVLPPYFVPENSEGPGKNYGCASFFCSWKL